MDDTTLETLEYPAVLKELASYAVTGPGVESINAIRPVADIEAIAGALRLFSEAAGHLSATGRFPLSGASDITGLLARLAPIGSYLLPEDLMRVHGNIMVNLSLKEMLTPDFSAARPELASVIIGLGEAAPLNEELERILDGKGGIKDTASPELNRLRREIRASRGRAKELISGIVADKKYKDLLQDDYISIRDDRYVIAVKSSMKYAMDGVIHGVSGSGESCFVEPMALVELNNRVSILIKDEHAEVVLILKQVSALIGASKDALINDQRLIAVIDVSQAKADFASAMRAVLPQIKSSGAISLKGARHPILAVKEARGEGRAVPIDLMIEEGCRVLVISGANTGGKTVALKTLGLNMLMAASGIPILAEEGSTAVVFNDVYSDIGDRQDIVASLSTFSAHVKRLKEFLSEAGPGSLVLVDEIGAGTDPSEGGALALSAIERFKENGAVTVVTTHLNILKARAIGDNAFMNASVEFDEKSLKPLYRLRYGVPGPSLGLSIAESLGIPADIITQARANIKEYEGAFIESARMLDEKIKAMQKLEERLSEQVEKRDKALARLKDQREAIKEKARARIESAVEKAREEIRKIVEKSKSVKVKSPSRAVEDIGRAAVSKLTHAAAPAGYVPKAGDRVTISGSGAKGVVERVDEAAKQAELTVGTFKVTAPFDKLLPRGGAEAKSYSARSYATTGADVTQTLNIIGVRVDDALAKLTKFLDNAHASGLGRIEIIHGVGTGALAKAVDEYLRESPLVAAHYRGDPDRGGAGVTIAELK